ncbi:sensor histidine kinase [Micromonospora halophytica]|uniref:sensor histidine kinase n=1 Tax=Micromonospora halophytica TaxID=47864 RepID=UPI001FE0CA8B|nr:histidine kinase [Micromonospora halophytica]
MFLLLGGVLVLPYVLLGATFAQLLTRGEVPRPLVLGLAVIAAVIGAVPFFLDGSRALEIAAVRALLGVRLPEPATGHPADRETRLRAALWIAMHMTVGGVVMFALISALPMALSFIAAQFGIGAELVARERFGPLDGRDTGWLSLTGVLVLLGLGYAVAGLGALATSMAPALLGPSPGERIAALEARAARLAERNRLARELHDSVGHALTVATLQAGAARQLLDDDPEFVRRALTAIEETSRHAMDDLDHVLGLLRDNGDGSRASAGTAPQRTLTQLDRLVADTRTAGLPVTAEITGDLGELPAVVSREGYRIVQEGLTNAARYGRGPVRLRVGVPGEPRAGADPPDGRWLEIELDNALAGAARPGRAGRGLDGMRERVLLLGGRITAGPEDDRWRVRVRLPVSGGETR